MQIEDIIKKNKQFKKLMEDYTSGHMAHAYLFKTEDTILSENMCYLFSSLANNCSTDRIKKNIHPDVKIYGQNGKIDVAAIGDITDELFTSPYEADKKIYILLNFDEANETCQNKLLKSLEEPSKSAIFLLTAKTTKTILSTVLSRVQTLEIDGVSTSDIKQYLQDNGVGGQSVETVAAISGGNITLANQYTSGEYLQMFDNLVDLLGGIKSSRDCLIYASLFDKKSTDFNTLLDILVLLLRDIMVIVSGEESLVKNKQIMDKLKVISSQFTTLCCAKIISMCLILKEDLYYNANSTAVLDRLLLTIAEEKVKCKKL